MLDNDAKLAERIRFHYEKKSYIDKFMDVRRAEIQNFEPISYTAKLENTTIPEGDSEIEDLAQNIGSNLANLEFIKFIISLKKVPCKTVKTTLDKVGETLDQTFDELWDLGLRIGNLFSPVIASTITGKTRAMLYEFVQKYEIAKDVVSFATDSIITTNRLDVDSVDLGGFAYENSGDDVYVLQNGIYRFNGVWKKRGIGNLGNRQIEHLDTVERDGKLYQVMKVLRVNRLRTAILSDSISEIEKFKTVERLVNLNADRKRMWFEELVSVNDGKIVDSLPTNLNYY